MPIQTNRPNLPHTLNWLPPSHPWPDRAYVRTWAWAAGGRAVRMVWACALALSVLSAALIPARSASAAEELNVLVWVQYLSPALVEKFERETGIKVRIETFDTDEVLYKRLRKNRHYDLAFPSDTMAIRLISEAMLERIDAAGLPGFENIDLQWRAPHYDRGNHFVVPLDWGTTGMMVDTAAYQGMADSLALLFDPPEEVKGRISMLRDVSDVFALTLRYLKLPRCTTDPKHLAQAEALLKRQKPWVKMYDAEKYIDAIVKGEISVAMAWSGDGARGRARRGDVRYVYPKEGVSAWMDTMVVPRGAPHKANALRFIQFTLVPENSALQASYTRNGPVVQGADAAMPAELQKAPEILQPVGVKMDFFHCLPSTMDLYRKIYETILPPE